ncbi:hypothetical protein CVU75_00800 [Candidatus Dependentiae bacterium HGW-Dependentiae-1]|nr:MAG: hypothetical protein CVU75_00800 [Candidatus Dependentiae bacterium HGW-Dependentiae-1]
MQHNKTINKLFLGIFLTLLNAIPTYATPEQKTAVTIATSLLTKMPSSLTTDAIAALIADTHKQAHKYALNEQAVLKELIAQIDTKIEYYQQLVDTPKKGYWESAKSFGVAALLAAISYGGHYVAFRDPQKTEDELYLEGAREVKIKHTFLGLEATAHASPNSDHKKIKSLLFSLAYLNAERPAFILITFASGLLSAGSTLVGIQELYNVICAKNYLKNYLILKSELTKTVY